MRPSSPRLGTSLNFISLLKDSLRRYHLFKSSDSSSSWKIEFIKSLTSLYKEWMMKLYLSMANLK